MSPSPCLSRVRALEERGFIRRYVTLLDPQRVGMKVSVFIQVTLEKQIEPALEVFEKAIRARPEVMECYLMTGEADYLLRVVVPDLQALEHFILNFLSRVPGVGNIKSSFALKQVKYQTALPLPEQNAGSRARQATPRTAPALRVGGPRRKTAPRIPRPRANSTQLPGSGTAETRTISLLPSGLVPNVGEQEITGERVEGGARRIQAGR